MAYTVTFDVAEDLENDEKLYTADEIREFIDTALRDAYLIVGPIKIK